LVETDIVEWFYKDLITMKHYVPIKNDLSDLLEKVEWLKANDDKAYEIAQAGSVFARYHF
jgi:hypothetical protein